MWIEMNASNVQEILGRTISDLREYEQLPVLCPACCTYNAHVFMHRFKRIKNPDMFWVWCSRCETYFQGKTTIHASFMLNFPEINEERLIDDPDYLESVKKLTDDYMNRFRAYAKNHTM